MNRHIMKNYAHLLMMVSLLLVMVGCGLLEFFGKRDETNPTDPCVDLIPTVTPVPIPTFVPPTATPPPGKTPVPMVTATPPLVTTTPPPPPTLTPTPGPCSGPGQVLICDGKTTKSADFEVTQDNDIPAGSDAPPMEDLAFVTITGHDMQRAALTTMLRDINGSGIDLVVSAATNVFTITLSHPISSAYLKTRGNTDEVILKAFDTSDHVVDMDISASELIIYGKDIVKLVLVKANGEIDELSVIPQL